MPFASEATPSEPAGAATFLQSDDESNANRIASSFFDMPSAIHDKEYVDSSNTEVAWTPGYFDLIEFVPWKKFEAEVWSKGMRSFRDIPNSMKSSAKCMIDAARFQVAESNEEEQRISREAAELSSGESSPSSDGAESDESNDSSHRLPIEQKDSGAFTNCASVKPMMDGVVLAVQSLLRASLSLDPEKRRFYIRCKNEVEVSTVKLTRSLGDSLRLSTPQNIKADVGVVLGFVKKKRKNPDSAVRLDSGTNFNVGGILPLCSFEMKGPTLDLTGMPAIAKMKSSSQSATAAASSNSDAAEGNTETNVSAAAVVYTPEEVADAFNFLFSKSSFINRKMREGGPIRSSIYRISQVVTYAILSLGRCAFLYNLQSGIGFRVLGCSNKKVTVAVTGVLLPDKAPNCGSSMFAIAKYCIDQYFSLGVEGLSSKVKEIAEKVSDQAFNRDSEPSDSRDSDYIPEQEDIDDYEYEENIDGDTLAPSEAPETFSSSKPLNLSLNSLHLRASNEKHRLRTSSGVLNENLNSMQVSRTIDVAINDMFKNFDEVVGNGSNSVVIKSKFMKKEVAVKMPFDSPLSSKQSVSHEIKTYRELHMEKSPLLGDVLPRLVLGWNTPARSSVYAHMVFLVTEYVGRGLTRNKSGLLCIGDRNSGIEVLNEQEERQICLSALEGLRKMQRHGIYHRDVALRNLRAERVEGRSVAKWRTWWVDLGSSTRSLLDKDSILCDIDCIEANQLFK